MGSANNSENSEQLNSASTLNRSSPASNKRAEEYFHIVGEVKMKVSVPNRAIAGPVRRRVMPSISTSNIILFMRTTWLIAYQTVAITIFRRYDRMKMQSE